MIFLYWTLPRKSDCHETYANELNVLNVNHMHSDWLLCPAWLLGSLSFFQKRDLINIWVICMYINTKTLPSYVAPLNFLGVIVAFLGVYDHDNREGNISTKDFFVSCISF